MTYFDRGRNQSRSLITGNTIGIGDASTYRLVLNLEERAQHHLDNLPASTDGHAVELWADLVPMSEPREGTQALARIFEIAKAYKTVGTKFHDDDNVRDRLISAFQVWARNFNPNRIQSGNWWFWEIGIPKLLVAFGILMFSDLVESDRRFIDEFMNTFVPDPNRRTIDPGQVEVGANRADKAHVVILHGLIVERPERIRQGADAVSDVAGGGSNAVLRYVDRGDGFYRDGSYIQHGRLAQMGSYGQVTLNSVADIFGTLSGTPWQVKDPKIFVLLDGIENNVAPFVFNAGVLDCVRGRAVSREDETDQVAGSGVVGNVLFLAEIFPEYRDRFRELVKGWLSRRASFVDPLTNQGLFKSQFVRRLLSDPSIASGESLVRHIQTPDQLRVVHHRGSWVASFALSSNRLGRYAWGNAENNCGWYQGDGAVQVRIETDLLAFSGNYWATSDPYHLPGVTNGQEPREPAPKDRTPIPPASQEWAGGVGWLGRIGAVGMDHLAYDGDLAAKKSWFALPYGIVSLGAGISSSQGQRVHTTIEARKLQSDTQSFVVDGSVVTQNPGSTLEVSGARWAHLESIGGYLFLDDHPVTLLRERRGATWSTVNSLGSDAEVTDSYQTAFVDHGTDPADETYQYALLPGATPQETAEHALNPGFTVVSNTPIVQAITVQEDELVMANFYAPGKVREVAVNVRASVIVGIDRHGPFGTLDQVVTASVPPRHDKIVAITVKRIPGVVIEYPDRSEFDPSETSYRLTFDSKGTRGHSVHWRLMPQPAQLVSHSEMGNGFNVWNYVDSGWDSSDSEHRTSSSQAVATLPFRGSAIGLQSAYDPSHGILEVSVDDGPIQFVDTFGVERAGVKIVTVLSDLDPDRDHVLKVKLSDQRNPRVTNPMAAISGAVILP